jgi:hypothetical protein
MIVRTPNEFRRDAIFLPVSFEEFWNSEIHQDHIKPRRVHLSRVMRELFIGLPVARVVGPLSRVNLGALLAR